MYWNLNSLKKSGKIITVFGCGGDRDRGKDRIYTAIITSDNPRSEDPNEICKEIAAGIPSAKEANYLLLNDSREAIKLACTSASSGDVILIAGKGHEKYQIIGDETHHFDDLAVTMEIFKKINK